MTRFKLSRRTMLRGLLGGGVVTIGLPPLEACLNATGTAYADGRALPRRFGLFWWGNGMLPQHWTPEGLGEDYTLSPLLEPLAALQSQVSVITGTKVNVPNIVPHYSGAAGLLTGMPEIAIGDDATFAGPTIDVVLGQAIGGNTRFRHIEFGAEAQEGLSYNGPHNRNPPEENPAALFQRIFVDGFVAPGGEPVFDPKLALRRSVLDSVVQDANRLRDIVSKADSVRIEQHLDGIRELERKIARLEEDPPDLAACSVPEAPEPEYPDIDGRPQLSLKNEVMSDIMAMALACDQTRVFSNFFTHPVNNKLFPGAPDGHHNLTHDEPGDQPEVFSITLQCIEAYAYQLQALANVQEGEGTLLDNCVVLGSSEISLGRTHSLEDFPILLGGSCAGRLKTGIHYRSETAENSSKVVLSILRAMGMPLGSWGVDENRADEGLSAIET